MDALNPPHFDAAFDCVSGAGPSALTRRFPTKFAGPQPEKSAGRNVVIEPEEVVRVVLPLHRLQAS